MASVTSLGLHQPSGLRHAIEEQILPANPPEASYRWIIDSGRDGQQSVEDELLVTETAVIWSRGRIVCKTFRFDNEKEQIVKALLAYFPNSHSTANRNKAAKTASSSDRKTDDEPLEKALVVFLKTQAHIYFLSGTSHIVHIPFEVEAACAGPVGVLIQRKRDANKPPAALKFPRVPTNSFISSQVTDFTSSQQSFIVDGVEPSSQKPLAIGLNSSLAQLFEDPVTQTASQWPRLVSLMDPLLELGLVVTDHKPQTPRPKYRRQPRNSNFLDPAEQLLHVEQIPLQGACFQEEELIIAVTVNAEANLYSIWRLKYLEHEDPFVRKRKILKEKASRRRSSIAPPYLGTPATPAKPGLRESFGAPLPGKRQRNSDRVEKPVDLVSSLEKHDKEGSAVTRRSSRRLSSMLARADLSASQERSAFADQPTIPTTRRHDSYSNIHTRSSSGFGHQGRGSLNSLLEAPLDVDLHEGFHNMGLDDPDFDGLQKDLLFSRIYQFPLEKTHVHVTDPTSILKNSQVFTLCSPSFATNEHSRNQLLIGVQDAEERRLNIVDLNIVLRRIPEADQKANGRTSSIAITSADLRKAKNVVDSCKLVDDDHSAILILSESMDGRHELSTQAPWSERTTLWPELVFVDDTRSLQYQGRKVDRDIKHRKSEVIDLLNGSIVGLRYPRSFGVVDAVDVDGRLHQLKIQLRPRNPQVGRVLAMCRNILEDANGERIHGGWLHVMQWLKLQNEPLPDPEWSAVTILLFTLILNLGRGDSNAMQTARLPMRRRRNASGSFGSVRDMDDWKLMEAAESTNSLGCPPWMTNRGWQWALHEDADVTSSPSLDDGPVPKFISRHVGLTRDYMVSQQGAFAIGPNGYLPTSLARNDESRRKTSEDILLALHLLLEEEKLDIMSPEHATSGRTDLRVVLCQLARWLRWHNFMAIYELGIQEDVDRKYDSELVLNPPIPAPATCPNILEWIQNRFMGMRSQYRTPMDIYYADKQLSEDEKMLDTRWDSIVPRTMMFKRFFRMLKPTSSAVEMVEAMYHCGLTKYILQTLPEGVLVPLQDAITLCQPHPPHAWSPELLELVKRSDMISILSRNKPTQTTSNNLLAHSHNAAWDYRLLCQSVEETNNLGYDDGEGTERQAVIRALFKEDRRLNEAQDLLSTHKSRAVFFKSHELWTESEYLEKQKELVARIATGTLAIPAGRGLLYFSLRFPLITQKLHIGGFNLNCIIKPTNVTVGVDKSMFTEEKVCWGFFHQGVAAGLAISPQAKGIDTSWILYNKPGQELSNRHAGFLLALGLNGHLKDVAKWVAFKYLTPKHTMTSIGLLLGLAASYMGTMDSLITRLLSVHATRMLPRGAAELNLSPLTQTSGIMGIGLLYCNSQHRRMSEIMLSEIEHIEDEDEEEPLRSECYRLAAGFALGFINLGKGNDLKGLSDMKLTDKLITHATSTKIVEIVHVLDRAAAGAVMAIALIFMKTEDQIVARKIDVPESILQFDYVRPDILLLRTVAKNIILWSKIEPTMAWVESSLPAAYRSQAKLSSIRRLKSTDLPFFSILAGICFSIALRFSGSASTKVRDLLLHYLDHFMRIASIEPTERDHPDAAPLYDEELARANARMCQDVLALSTGIVMAGTGDIPVLRRLRALHGRDDPNVPYGSHLAAHLAIGALFLGCGTATFGTSNIAIASLLLSFYPVLPTNVMDNRAHLQAFRHFWVLAAEQRCLVAKDVLTDQPVSIPVHIKLRTPNNVESIAHRTTPCLLPPLDQILSLSTKSGSRYWDVRLDFSDDKVREAFAETQSVYLRRRPPVEGTFTSTLSALGDAGKDQNPLQWILHLDSLESVSYAQKAALLNNAEDEQDIGAAVDAKMEMERGILDGGDMERLEGTKLLFEWSAVRDRLAPRKNQPASTAAESMATMTASMQLHAEHADDDDGEAHGTTWFMRDSDIESLKGKVWLAAREADE